MPEEEKRVRRCKVCGQTGHVSFECPERGPKPLTPEQKGVALEEMKKVDLYLHVEDNIDVAPQINHDLEQALGGKEKIITAGSTKEAKSKLEGILADLKNKENPGGLRLCVIHDLEIPISDGGFPESEGGMQSLKEINNAVGGWNAQHPDRPVEVEIIMNSSKLGDEESQNDFRDRFPMIKGFSNDKKDAVEAVERYLVTKSKSETSEVKKSEESAAAATLAQMEKDGG